MRFYARIALAAALLLQPGFGSPRPQGQMPPVIQQADEEYGKGNFNQAAALYQDALDHPPPELGEMPADFKNHLCIMIGASYTQLGRYEEAIAALNKANSFYQNASAHGWLGRAYFEMQNYPDAVRNFRKAIDLDPDSCELYVSVAQAASRSGQFDVVQKAIDGSQGKKCSDNDQSELRDAQILTLLAKHMYNDAYRLAGDRRMIGVDIRQIQGTVRILYVFDGGPAQLAGLAVGDVFESVNGTPIRSMGELASTLKSVPFSSTAVVRVTRNGSVQEKNVVVGIPPNLAELSAAAGQPFPKVQAEANSTETIGTSPPPSAKSSLAINRVEVKPASVNPGETFSIEISYTAAASGQISYTYSVHTAAAKLFESKPRLVEAEVGRAGLISIRQIPSTTMPGKYTIQVHLAMNDFKAEEVAALTVAKK
jgi:tetratricopeptide (TPR) repeat protein